MDHARTNEQRVTMGRTIPDQTWADAMAQKSRELGTAGIRADRAVAPNIASPTLLPSR